MHLEKGPVFLQETKWDSTQAGLLAQCFGTVQVLSSPGILLEDGNISGGVAILLPTYLSGIAVKATEIVPGHILQVEVGERGQHRTYVSVYLHPDRQQQILRNWEEYWTSNPPMGNLYIGGDFNQINQGGGDFAWHSTCLCAGSTFLTHPVRVNKTTQAMKKKRAHSEWQAAGSHCWTDGSSATPCSPKAALMRRSKNFG